MLKRAVAGHREGTASAAATTWNGSSATAAATRASGSTRNRHAARRIGGAKGRGGGWVLKRMTSKKAVRERTKAGLTAAKGRGMTLGSARRQLGEIPHE